MLSNYLFFLPYCSPNYDPSGIRYAKKTTLFLYGMGCQAKPVDGEVYFRLNKEPVSRMSFWMRFRKSRKLLHFNSFINLTFVLIRDRTNDKRY